MEKEDSRLELRSEKVRNIIGEIPPKLIRIGTAVTLLIVAAMIVALLEIHIDGKSLWQVIFG